MIAFITTAQRRTILDRHILRTFGPIGLFRRADRRRLNANRDPSNCFRYRPCDVFKMSVVDVDVAPSIYETDFHEACGHFCLADPLQMRTVFGPSVREPGRDRDL